MTSIHLLCLWTWMYWVNFYIQSDMSSYWSKYPDACFCPQLKKVHWRASCFVHTVMHAWATLTGRAYSAVVEVGSLQLSSSIKAELMAAPSNLSCPGRWRRRRLSATVHNWQTLLRSKIPPYDSVFMANAEKKTDFLLGVISSVFGFVCFKYVQMELEIRLKDTNT